MGAIKRGVSLYSYQEEYFHGKLDLEAQIAASASFGAYGVEIIPAQTFASYPNVSDREIDEWHELHAKYGTVPTACDSFADLTRRKDRLLSVDEVVEDLIADIKLSSRLGCRIVRVQLNTPVEAFVRAAPYAQDHGQVLAMEVHSPLHYEHRLVRRFVDAIVKVDNGALGLMGDMSTWVRTFPRVMSDQALRRGARPELVQYVRDAFESHDSRDMATLAAEVFWAGGNEADQQLAQMAGWLNWADPQTLIPHIPYLVHIQAKFYEMPDENAEYSIPYEELVPFLAEHGYQGYLSSEYEGNRFVNDAFSVDSVEQVRRHHVMLARLLGEPLTLASSLEEEPNRV